VLTEITSLILSNDDNYVLTASLNRYCKLWFAKKNGVSSICGMFQIEVVT